jgi:uncharacterized protein (DUF2252 family)
VSEFERKLCALACSDFTFFRGTSALAVSQFNTFAGERAELDEDGLTWCLGDAHLENLGGMHDAAGSFVYDANDFDEAAVAHFYLDVWRFAASLALAITSDRGDRLEAGSTLEAWSRDAMAAFAAGYADGTTATSLVGQSFTRPALAATFGEDAEVVAFLDSRVEDGETLESEHAALLADWTYVDGSGARVLKEPCDDDSPTCTEDFGPLPTELAALFTSISSVFDPAIFASPPGLTAPPVSHGTIKGVALRIGAGTGSAGFRRFYVLAEGPTSSVDDDLIVDIKEQILPPLAVWARTRDARDVSGITAASSAADVVARAAVAIGRDVEPATGSIKLGSFGVFSVRTRSPFKSSLKWGKLIKKDRVDRFVTFAREAGTLLAALHMRGAASLGRTDTFAAAHTAFTTSPTFVDTLTTDALALAFATQDDRNTYMSNVQCLMSSGRAFSDVCTAPEEDDDDCDWSGVPTPSATPDCETALSPCTDEVTGAWVPTPLFDCTIFDGADAPLATGELGICLPDCGTCDAEANGDIALPSALVSGCRSSSCCRPVTHDSRDGPLFRQTTDAPSGSLSPVLIAGVVAGIVVVLGCIGCVVFAVIVANSRTAGRRAAAAHPTAPRATRSGRASRRTSYKAAR